MLRILCDSQPEIFFIRVIYVDKTVESEKSEKEKSVYSG